MSDKQPEFQSNIPSYLLETATPQDKWMMENMSVLSQKTNWLAQEQERQSTALGELKEKTESIETQTKKTNGRTTKNEDDIKHIQEKFNFVSTVFNNKFTWVAMAGFFLFGYPFILEYRSQIFKAIFSIFLS